MTDTPPMTDTPVNVTTYPPPPLLEQIRVFAGDLARPFAIVSASFSASWATIALAMRAGIELNSAGFFVAAAWAGVAALYLGKAAENANIAKHTVQAQAGVDTAKAQAGVSQ